MKVHVYRDRIALDALAVIERPDPTPGPRDIVIRVRAVALNYRDLAIARGNYHAGVAAPLVPLSDAAGEVVALGREVTRFRLGDIVCPTYLPDWIDGPIHARLAARRLGGPSDGVFAELICLDEEAAVRAPSHLDAVEACSLPVSAVTAWHALHRTSRLAPGDTLLVQGTGAVSLAALQIAKAGGARVIAVTRTDRHEQRLRTLGASDVIPLGDTADSPAEVMKRTGGRGVDIAVEVVGGSALARTIASTRLGASIHLVGYAGGTTASLDIFDAIRRGSTIHVATAGPRASFEAMNRAFELNAVRPPIDRVFPAERYVDAFAHLAAGGHFGKVVIALA